jgi:GNAT superfamily N-acetyltransferase
LLIVPLPEPDRDLRFEPVSDKYDFSTFDCGPYTYLSDHLRRGYALRDEAAGHLRTYLLILANPETDDPPVVVGFFALEASIMDTRDVPASARFDREATPQTLPVIYLTMLARHKDYRGQGMGAKLLLEALGRSVIAARVIGAAGVYAYAVSAEAYRLNRDFRFYDLEGGRAEHGNRMFLPMSEARIFINESGLREAVE